MFIRISSNANNFPMLCKHFISIWLQSIIRQIIRKVYLFDSALLILTPITFLIREILNSLDNIASISILIQSDAFILHDWGGYSLSYIFFTIESLLCKFINVETHRGIIFLFIICFLFVYAQVCILALSCTWLPTLCPIARHSLSMMSLIKIPTNNDPLTLLRSLLLFVLQSLLRLVHRRRRALWINRRWFLMLNNDFLVAHIITSIASSAINALLRFRHILVIQWTEILSIVLLILGGCASHQVWSWPWRFFN